MDEIVDKLRVFSTATLSDAMDRLGISGVCYGIKPLRSDYRLAGRAFTVHYSPVGSEHGTVGDYVDDVEPGQVIVLDNSGRLDCTVWGDILTLVANLRGIAGTVIYGVCRDVNRSFELNYPVFSCGTFMRTGKDRVLADGFNIPVEVGQARVRPGDIVIGDADGLVIIPYDREQDILNIAIQIEEAEEMIRQDVLAGMRLDESRKRHRYHKLQSRRS